MAARKSFWTGWHERIAALRNVPAVLKIVWDSGPAVVMFGLVARLFSALLPVVLLWIIKLIIDAIVHSVSSHRAVHARLWWLVAARVFGRRSEYHFHPGDRLLRFIAGRQVHPLHQHSRHESRGQPRPAGLRGPGFLRPAGTDPGAGHGPSRHDSGGGTARPAGHHHRISLSPSQS